VHGAECEDENGTEERGQQDVDAGRDDADDATTMKMRGVSTTIPEKDRGRGERGTHSVYVLWWFGCMKVMKK